MPTLLKYIIACAIGIAMLPPAIIAHMRMSRPTEPRIHFIQDMDSQPRAKAQAAAPPVTTVIDGTKVVHPLFADNRVARPAVAGAVARDQLRDPADRAFFEGTVDGKVGVATFPKQVNVNRDLILRGKEKFEIYCSSCHGKTGFGDGLVQKRTELLQLQATNSPGMFPKPPLGGWVPPLSLHDQKVKDQPVGEIFHTITAGIRTMPAYGPQIEVADRWAIIAYIRVLQLAQDATAAVGAPTARIETSPTPQR